MTEPARITDDPRVLIESETGSGPGSGQQPVAGSTPRVGPSAADQTGHPGVDAVLTAMDRVESLALGERVPVFERAHEDLRAALVDAGDTPRAPG